LASPAVNDLGGFQGKQVLEMVTYKQTVLLDGRDMCKYVGYDKRRGHTPNCYLFVGPS